MSVKDSPQSPLELAQTYQESAEALGATLAEARKRLGLEQREVATRLGLNPVLIRRLEEGAFQDLGAPVYARGYLTRYVRFLDLPEQEMLDRHKRLGVSEVPPLRVTRPIKPQARMSDRGVRWFSYLLIFAVIGWIGWQGYEQVTEHLDAVDETSSLKSFSKPNENTISLPQPEQATSSLSQPEQAPSPDHSGNAAGTVLKEITPPVSALLTQEAAPVPTPPDSPDSAVSVDPATDPSASVPAVPLTSPLPSEPPATASAPATAGDLPSSTESASTPPVAATAPAAGPPELRIEFTQDCWVEVKDANGERLAYGIMKADTTTTVSGVAPFSITFGNAVGVRAITLNGNPVDQSLYLPERGTVSRFVVDLPQP